MSKRKTPKTKPQKPKKKPTPTPFADYTRTLSDERQAALTEFFDDFALHCLLPRRERAAMRRDFEAALLYYHAAGVEPETALERLAPENLGGFYARPPVLWFPLDDAAKIYPLSMKHGQMAMFRLAVNLKSDVVPELLQMALTFTIKRFPTFATTLKKGFFWHYLDTTKRRFCVEPERDIPCRPLAVSRSGSQSFRVLYHERRIAVEFFHVLTDGTGAMTFLTTLTAEYLRLCGAELADDGSVWDMNATPAVQEFENAFARIPTTASGAGFLDHMATQMDGRLSRRRPARVLHFRMDAQALKAAAARQSCTVTAYLLTQMFLAGRAATDELTGEASIQVPINMRKFYPSPTVRNFSLYCGVRVPLDSTASVSELAAEITAQLERKASREAMEHMLASTRKLVTTLRFVPLVIKQPVAGLIYGFLGDKIFCNTLSNLGVVTMPAGSERYIESMDFLLGTVLTNRVACAVVTFGGVTTFSITKNTVDPTFEKAMYRLLSEDGIAVTVEGSCPYEG